MKDKYFCKKCASHHTLCPTGHYIDNYAEHLIELPKVYQIDVFNIETESFLKTEITHLCNSCCNHKFINGDVPFEDLTNISDPFNETPVLLVKERYVKSVLSGLMHETSFAMPKQSEEEPF